MEEIDDRLICLMCGRRFHHLVRHVSAMHIMSAEQYKRLFNLPKGYKMMSLSHRDRMRVVNKETGVINNLKKKVDFRKGIDVRRNYDGRPPENTRTPGILDNLD